MKKLNVILATIIFGLVVAGAATNGQGGNGQGGNGQGGNGGSKKTAGAATNRKAILARGAATNGGHELRVAGIEGSRIADLGGHEST
ncbi:MAG: hypothetical protein A2428_15565 [Bdellovibrionales bacterium RIFOXYC1_FULL_54_43]|nr:MAG: hypothetical protein A2428_15565 [Bdellovibrionales bacterium RIFOXYC1_FULL_54_43]OFZ84785.1 MAG: hypothetical protein A2603_05385 [Bdellovibrionales bacterium RIFOXYD1_FULL_55_31]